MNLCGTPPSLKYVSGAPGIGAFREEKKQYLGGRDYSPIRE